MHVSDGMAACAMGCECASAIGREHPIEFVSLIALGKTCGMRGLALGSLRKLGSLEMGVG